MRLLALTLASTLMSSAALAADAIYSDAPVAPAIAEPSPFSWTGFYAGLHGGLTTGDFDYAAGTPGFDPDLTASVSGGGFLGGAQAGFDWQQGNWVLGGVVDIAATNHDAELSGNLAGVGSASAKSTLEFLGTVRGRLGYAVDRALIYGHGGFAYGKTEQSIDLGALGDFSDSQSRTGWTVGGGIEYALTDKLSFGTEYAYVDLGEERVYEDNLLYVDEDVAFHTIKAVLNVHF